MFLMWRQKCGEIIVIVVENVFYKIPKHEKISSEPTDSIIAKAKAEQNHMQPV